MHLNRHIDRAYDLIQVYALNLDDSPFLQVLTEDGDWTPIQTSHFHHSELLRFTSWATTWWQYIHTTREMIPIFHAVNSSAVLSLCTVEADRSSRGLWVVPKAFPREQYAYGQD